MELSVLPCGGFLGEGGCSLSGSEREAGILLALGQPEYGSRRVGRKQNQHTPFQVSLAGSVGLARLTCR